MKIINLTPHELSFIADDGTVVRKIPSSGTVARVRSTSKQIGEIDGIPVFSTEFGELVDLPDPAKDTIYVASTLVAQTAAKAGRTDVFSPADLVRDSEGNVVGCKGLQMPEGVKKLPAKKSACTRELREYVYAQIQATGDEYLTSRLQGEWYGVTQTVLHLIKYLMRLPDLNRIREDNLEEAKAVADKVIDFLKRETSKYGRTKT